MIDFRNPYTPGAGKTPKFIAGRDDIIENAEQNIKATLSGYPSRSIIYYGLRGVGKTVILNAIEEICDNEYVLNCHIEVKDDSNFIKSLSIACNGFIQSISAKEDIKDKLSKLLAVFKSFTTKYNPEDNTFSFSLSDQPIGYGNAGTGDLANDITELLVTLGKYAKNINEAICFCIDEIQYAKVVELEALVTAIHRINQLDLPIVFFCAGLPKILKTMGEIKSYTERLFEFIKIDSLTQSEAKAAITIPAEKLKVKYTDAALTEIIQITEGYPYFIQELCSTIWSEHNKTNLIDLADVTQYIGLTYNKLDVGFFMVRYDRCTPKEKDFIVAMVLCDKLPCTVANVACIMSSSSKSISPLRAQLINKGIIYATGHGEIDFTVPQFDKFLKRINPNLEMNSHIIE